MIDYNNNALLTPSNLVEAIIDKAEDFNRLISSGEDRPLELLDSITSLKDEIDELKACLEMWDWFNTQLATTDTEDEAIEATLQMYGDRFGMDTNSSGGNLKRLLKAFIEDK